MSEDEKITDKELKEALAKSAKEVGYLYPVIKSPDGEVIAGKHRLEADPEWPSVIREDLDTDMKKAQVKIIENLVRREVSAEEKVQMLSELAEAIIAEGFEGNIVHEIAERIGWKRSIRWIQLYLPERYKQMEMKKEAKEREPASEELAKIDIRKWLSMSPKQRKDEGLSWRGIMAKHDISSSVLARLKEEVETDIASDSKLIEKEMEHIEASDGMVVERFEGVKGGKSATSQVMTEAVQEQFEEEPVDVLADVTKEEVELMQDVIRDLEKFIERSRSLDHITPYGQGIVAFATKFLKTTPLSMYEGRITE